LSPLKGAAAIEIPESATPQKSHGLSHVFGEKLRRGISYVKNLIDDNNFL